MKIRHETLYWVIERGQGEETHSEVGPTCEGNDFDYECWVLGGFLFLKVDTDTGLQITEFR